MSVLLVLEGKKQGNSNGDDDNNGKCSFTRSQMNGRKGVSSLQNVGRDRRGRSERRDESCRENVRDERSEQEVNSKRRSIPHNCKMERRQRSSTNSCSLRSSTSSCESLRRQNSIESSPPSGSKKSSRRSGRERVRQRSGGSFQRSLDQLRSFSSIESDTNNDATERLSIRQSTTTQGQDLSEVQHSSSFLRESLLDDRNKRRSRNSNRLKQRVSTREALRLSNNKEEKSEEVANKAARKLQSFVRERSQRMNKRRTSTAGRHRNRSPKRPPVPIKEIFIPDTTVQAAIKIQSFMRNSHHKRKAEKENAIGNSSTSSTSSSSTSSRTTTTNGRNSTKTGSSSCKEKMDDTAQATETKATVVRVRHGDRKQRRSTRKSENHKKETVSVSAESATVPEENVEESVKETKMQLEDEGAAPTTTTRQKEYVSNSVDSHSDSDSNSSNEQNSIMSRTCERDALSIADTVPEGEIPLIEPVWLQLHLEKETPIEQGGQCRSDTGIPQTTTTTEAPAARLKLTTTTAAIKLQTFIRGAFQRMDYRLMLLEDKLCKINHSCGNDIDDFELHKVRKMYEVRESWIHVARETLSHAAYIKDKRMELRMGMVDYLSLKNITLQKEYDDLNTSMNNMKQNNTLLENKKFSTTMRLLMLQQQVEKANRVNAKLNQAVQEGKKQIHEMEKQLMSTRIYHRLAYRKGQAIEKCVDDIYTVLQERCKSSKLIREIRSLINNVKEYRKCKHMEHCIDSTNIFRLLQIQHDLMK